MMIGGDDKERLLQMARENGSQAQLAGLMQTWEDSAQVVWLMKPDLRDKYVARILFDDRTESGGLVTVKRAKLHCNGDGWEVEEI